MPLFTLASDALHVAAVIAINKPSAVRFKKYTYVAFYGSDYGIRVIKFNNGTLKVEQDKRIASNPIGTDAHGAPAIIVDSQGYIHVMYGSHNSTQYYAKSVNPEDISNFNIKTVPITSPTYPQLAIGYKNGVEIIWLGYRGGTVSRIVYTQDGGGTFSSERTIVDFGSPYVIYPWGIISDMKKPTSALHFCWHYYDSANYVRENVYYAKSLDGGETWRKADGTALTLPITKTAADLVFDSTGLGKIEYSSGLYYSCTPSDIKLDEDGNPYILIHTPANGGVRVARYEAGWKVTTVATNLARGLTSCAFGRVSKSLIEVFAVGADAKLKKFKSTDGAKSFAFEGDVGTAYYNPAEYPSAGCTMPMTALDLTPQTGFLPLCVWAGSPLYLYGEEVPAPTAVANVLTMFIGGVLALIILRDLVRRIARATRFSLR